MHNFKKYEINHGLADSEYVTKIYFAIGRISSIIHDIKPSAGSGKKMLGDFKVEQSPMDNVKSTIYAAFSKNSKNRRRALRVVQRVLNLAEARGYPYSEGFHYYFQHESEQSDMLTKRWLLGLFEYVSPDEFTQLAKLNLL